MCSPSAGGLAAYETPVALGPHSIPPRTGTPTPFAMRNAPTARPRRSGGRLLVGVSDPQDERVIEEAPDELHADGQAVRRLAHGEGEGRVAGVVEGLGVAGAAPALRGDVVLDGLEVAARPVVSGRRHDAGGHHEHVHV